MDKYSQLISYIREQPWAIKPSYLAIMRDIIQFRNAGGMLTKEEIQERISAGDKAIQELHAEQERAAREGGGKVAVIPVFGVIAQHAYMVEDISGPRGTATRTISAELKRALGDSDIESIILHIHSPGGGVYGVEELAAEIRSARGEKPVVAVANAMAASAAYWIASAASEIVVTPSGEVGSIGVFSAHEDLSEALKMEGVKITLISAGKYKVEANPFEALGDEAKEYEQEIVNKYYNSFINGVAKGRGVSNGMVRKEFGQGRMVTAKEAVERRMADRVATLEETAARFAPKKRRRRSEGGVGAQSSLVNSTADGGWSLTFDHIGPDKKAEQTEELLELAEDMSKQLEEICERIDEDEDEARESKTKIQRWKQKALDKGY